MTEASLVRGGTVVTPAGRFKAEILAVDGRISAIGYDLVAPADAEILDATGLFVLPGMLDPHSHMWESGFVSGPDFRDNTASAVAGGITTIVEMPLTTPEVLDIAVFRNKIALGEKTSYADFALFGGVRPSNLNALEAMWDAGAAAFKIFTCDTGCAMHGLIQDSDLRAAMRTIAGFGGLAGFHAENDGLLVANRKRLDAAGRTDNAAFSEWHDETSELEAINRILFFAERESTRVNIVPRHLARRRGPGASRAGKGRGGDGRDLLALPLPDRGRHCRAGRLGHLLAADAQRVRARRHAAAGGQGRRDDHRVRSRPGRSQPEAARRQQRLQRAAGDAR